VEHESERDAPTQEKDGKGRTVVLLEQVHDAPGSDTGTVHELGFGRWVALTLRSRQKGTELVQNSFSVKVAVLDTPLSSFFVVQHEADGNAGLVGPLGVGRVLSVT
jgi:hypothetical protein